MTARAIIIAVLYASAAIIAVRSVPGVNIDMWWQMSSARWILQHHALPHQAIYANLKPLPAWHAYSWLYELLLYGLYRAFGLLGVLGYITGMVLAILAALHRMTSHVQKDFLPAIVIALAGVIVLMPLYTPRSWLFSILFFILQLDFLYRARESGQWKSLLWLLPMYALWANLHIQFIDGLVVLGATVCEPLLMRFWLWPQKPQLPASRLFVIFGGCIAATCVNPYGWGIYFSAYKLVSESYVFNYISELNAIPFRMWQNFVFLALVVAAAAVLARREKPDLWRWMLFAGGLIVSFRSYRDIWFLTVIASMILAEGISTTATALRPLPKLAWAGIGAVVVAALFLGVSSVGINNHTLKKIEYEAMPVRAVDAAIQNRYPGPVFNTYEWGGYLIWRMHIPVAIDGRAAVYGGKLIKRTQQTWSGQPDWMQDPNLKSANLVVAPVKDALTQLLRQDNDFRLAYQDKTAALFVRKVPLPAPPAR